MQNGVPLEGDAVLEYQSTQSRRYAQCIEVSKRVRWDIERDVIRGRTFDFSRKFLPDTLSKIDELSRGMQQKVQFIGTLLHEPDLVILDETFSGLDPINAQALKDTIIELKRKGKTVIFSTHIMDNAERICDSVCIIARGEKVLDGAISDIKESHGSHNIALALGGAPTTAVSTILSDRSLVSRVDDSNRYFEVEMANGADPQSLLQRIISTGATVNRFEIVRPSLHQIFLERVGAKGIEAGMSGHG